MDNRRAKLIAALIEHLESMDAEDLKGQLPQEAPVEAVVAIDPKKAEDVEKGFKGALGGPKVADGEKGPMEVLVAEQGGGGEVPAEGDEMDEDEFEEMVKLSS